MAKSKEYKDYWIIYHPAGTPVLFSLVAYRKDCIRQFLEGSALTWKECLNIGWTIHKVNISINPV